MAAATELYRTIVLEHGKRPRNVGRLTSVTDAADGTNPLCGDALHVEIARVGDVLVALRFEGESCVLATASASLMTERLVGVTTAEARRLIEIVETLCAQGPHACGADEAALGDLRAFADVYRHPVRVGCATLAWRTLGGVLAD